MRAHAASRDVQGEQPTQPALPQLAIAVVAGGAEVLELAEQRERRRARMGSGIAVVATHDPAVPARIEQHTRALELARQAFRVDREDARRLECRLDPAPA